VITRIVALSACLFISTAIVAKASKTEQVPPRQQLSQLPRLFDSWRGRDHAPFTPEVMKVLGADDYVSRSYAAPNNAYVGLYVGYYESQRQGDAIHSPLNCLPGAGWQPLAKSYLTVPVRRADGSTVEVTVNRYVIEKGLDRQVVLYWYHSHGRVVANEYRSKILMVYDAMRLNRSDAALVRITSPKLGSHATAEAEAETRAVEFLKDVFPLVDGILPS
jgi:EpsI family protein